MNFLKKESVALITATALISTVLILTLLASIDYLVAGAGGRACTVVNANVLLIRNLTDVRCFIIGLQLCLFEL